MSMTVRMHFVFIVFCAVIASIGNAAECDKGTRTSLQYTIVDVPANSRHDQGNGRTKFVLHSEPDGATLAIKEFDGQWFCFGYNAKTRAYIIGGISQKGAWLPLRSIQYLAEDGSSKPSAFDRLDYIALSAVTSPAGRHIVFIGGRIGIDGLFVLDIERDTIKKLGREPLPPPSSFAADSCEGQAFEWGGCGADGYVKMDEGILHFASDHELEVSYGKDKPTKRAKKRWVMRYKL